MRKTNRYDRVVILKSIKNDRVGFKINSLVKEALKKQAKAEGLSLSQFINKTLIEELRYRGVSIEVSGIKIV